MQSVLLERPSAKYTGVSQAYPVAASSAGAGRAFPARPARPILVVDDDPTIRTLVVEALSDDGYAVVEASDGAEGLQLCSSADPCLILLDMRMPVMDGWAFARAYREQFAVRVPIVVMTAARDARTWADQIGADDVLPKPFDLTELSAAIGRHC
jgi:two-component system chemotaxis response regulator CheY